MKQDIKEAELQLNFTLTNMDKERHDDDMQQMKQRVQELKELLSEYEEPLKESLDKLLKYSTISADGDGS